jgi:hypothetical protein
MLGQVISGPLFLLGAMIVLPRSYGCAQPTVRRPSHITHHYDMMAWSPHGAMAAMAVMVCSYHDRMAGMT